MIGLITAVIGDVASHLGCFIFLKDTVNAIAFVALGTSVPGKWPSISSCSNDMSAVCLHFLTLAVGLTFFCRFAQEDYRAEHCPKLKFDAFLVSTCNQVLNNRFLLFKSKTHSKWGTYFWVLSITLNRVFFQIVNALLLYLHVDIT